MMASHAATFSAASATSAQLLASSLLSGYLHLFLHQTRLAQTRLEPTVVLRLDKIFSFDSSS
jgi:hypothetical protein